MSLISTFAGGIIHIICNTMKHTKFFLNGKEISQQEAKEIEKKNKEYMNSGDFSLMLKCQFITVIRVDK